MNNELMMAHDESEDMIVSFTNRKASYCSLAADTPEEKAVLFRAMNNPDGRLKDCINLVIYVKDLFCEVVECTNKETGEVSKCPRIVVIDKDGKSYQSVSLGVFNAFKKLMMVYGQPTWAEPIPVKVKQITKGERSILTFDVEF